MKIRKFFKIFKKEMEKGYKEEKERQDQNKAAFIAENEKSISDFLARHKFLTVLIVLIPIILIIGIINSFLPIDVYDDINGMSPVSNIEYYSEKYKVGNHTVAIYACLDADGSENDTEQFVINVAEIKGPLKNKYYLYANDYISDEEIFNPDYSYIVDYPSYEVKSGSKYYGSVYAGIAPPDCESITIGGVKAEMEKMTFDFKGKTVDFYLYYCIIEQDEYPEHISVICQKTDGESLSVSSDFESDSDIASKGNSKVTVIG